MSFYFEDKSVCVLIFSVNNRGFETPLSNQILQI